MKKEKYLGLAFLLVLTLVFIFSPLKILAYRIEDLGFTGPPAGDFSLGPGKTELWMEPGEKVTKELYITNRLGKTMDFKIEIEDFTGSKNPEKTVVLLGEEKGPCSLKDYIKPELLEFTLKHGERMILPVEISIPPDAEPGGLYGAVLVSSYPSKSEAEKEKEKAVPEVRVISRLGTLFFVRVKGEVKESGFLKDIKVDKNFYEKGPISFELLFENKGNVHLVPYGLIEIRNLLGKKIDEIELDPWFAMPDSIRSRKIDWKRGFLLGRYTALAKVMFLGNLFCLGF